MKNVNADLYLKVLQVPLLEKYRLLLGQPTRRREGPSTRSRSRAVVSRKVDKGYTLTCAVGCFHDPGTFAGILRRLGMSWEADVVPLCTRERRLQGTNVKKLLRMVTKAGLHLPAEDEPEALHAFMDSRGEIDLIDLHKYYIEKRAELIAFLDLAIELQLDVSMH